MIKPYRMKQILALSGFLILVFFACTKSGSDAHCWQIIDYNGNNLEMICNKTETELINGVKNGDFGYLPVNTNFTNCNYFRAEGPKNCYMIAGAFRKDLYADEARLYGQCFCNNATVTQVDSNYCMFWYTRETITVKRNMNTYINGIHSQYYCADTLKTIYQSRKIVLKDDADSLIVISFSNDGMHW